MFGGKILVDAKRFSQYYPDKGIFTVLYLAKNQNF
jgi:hypothetical protein